VRIEDQKEFSAFLHEFQSETDRGAALVGAAMIDERLSGTLRSFMVSKSAAAQMLEETGAPLGTFSSRIKATYALGLIDAHERHEINLIRKVRNEFAHRTHGTDFNDPEILKFCRTLLSVPPGGVASYLHGTRGLFINAVILMVLRLTYRSEWVAREKRTTKSWPYAQEK
jgi:mannitol operon repressor